MMNTKKIKKAIAVLKERREKDPSINNPYLKYSFEELLYMLSGDNYTAPPMHTPEWAKFMHAMTHAQHDGTKDIE